MFAIYSNNTLINQYIKKLNFNQPYQIYHSIEQYLSADSQIKIAFVNHVNNIFPNPVNINPKDTFSQEIDKLKTHSSLLIAFDNEIHPYHCDLFRQHRQPNVWWAIPGRVNDFQLVDLENQILWNGHFDQLLWEYCGTLVDRLNEIKCVLPMPMYFDALLGMVRPHRDFVYHAIESKNLQQKILTTYANQDYINDWSNNNDFKTHFEWEPDIENFDDTVKLSTDYVQYRGLQIALSRIIPIQVYNRTAYSIVAETGWHNQYSFFTEKTAKPIMARRLFVMFSGYKFLQNLRTLGFQTFDTVIDESYDLMYNDNDRWSAAFEQVQRLCNMDQAEVFAKIAPAVEHNYHLVMNTDWKQHMLDQLQQKLTQFLATHDNRIQT